LSTTAAAATNLLAENVVRDGRNWGRLWSADCIQNRQTRNLEEYLLVVDWVKMRQGFKNDFWIMNKKIEAQRTFAKIF
jgi:hypothetical protein